jgi:outer membrane protein
MELTKQQVDRLETLSKEGAIRPSDLSDVKGQYAGDKVSIINAQTAVETAKINLCEFMNVPYDKNMTVERLDVTSFTDKYADTPDKIYETANAAICTNKSCELFYTKRRESCESCERRIVSITWFKCWIWH